MSINPPMGLTAYQKLLDRIPYLAWLLTDKGEIITVNQQWHKYFGQSNSKELAESVAPSRLETFLEILQTDERDRFSQRWVAARKSQEPLEIKLQLPSFAGNWEWFQVELEPDRNELEQIIWIGTAIRLGGETAISGQQQSFQFLEALLDHASDAIVACNAAGKLVLFNRMAQIFHELPPEPIDPEEWANYYDLYDRDGLRILTTAEIPLFRALQGESVVSQEIMIKSKQGKARSILTNGAAIYSPTGEKLGAVALMRDITDYQQAIISLQESEQKFRAIFDGVFQFIGLIQPDGTLVEANLTALQFGGMTAAEATGRRLWDIPGWKLSAAAQQQLQESIVRAAQGEFVRYEMEVMGAENRLASLDFSLMPIRNKQGEITLIIPEGRDISQLRQAEVDRAEAEHYSNRLLIALQVAKAGAWNWDLVTQKIFWTPEFETLFDYEPGSTQQVYSEWLARVHPDDREWLEALVEKTINQKLPEYRCEYRIIHRNNQIRWIDAIGELYTDEQGHPRLSGLVYDITERKELAILTQTQNTNLQSLNQSLMLTQQRLNIRNEELDSFVHMVSHDLKAPLRSISNLSEWIEDDLGDQIPADSHKQFKLLRQRVSRMDALIDGLLHYSRIGRQQLDTETVDVAQLLAEIIDSLSPPANFKIEILSPLPQLNTKKILLSQIFANLLSNAIKHHHQTTGLIKITAEDRGDHYQFSIADDGPGISPGKSRERIFEIFQTLQPNVSNENTGIGLALIKKIIEGEGGRIWLDESPQQGACFHFTWYK